MCNNTVIWRWNRIMQHRSCSAWPDQSVMIKHCCRGDDSLPQSGPGWDSVWTRTARRWSGAHRSGCQRWGTVSWPLDWGPCTCPHTVWRWPGWTITRTHILTDGQTTLDTWNLHTSVGSLDEILEVCVWMHSKLTPPYDNIVFLLKIWGDQSISGQDQIIIWLLPVIRFLWSAARCQTSAQTK